MKNLISDLALSGIEAFPVLPLKNENDIETLLEIIQGDFKIAVGSRQGDTVNWEMILNIPREQAKTMKYKFAEDNRIELVAGVGPIVVSIENMYIAGFEENVVNFPSYFGRQDIQESFIPEPFQFKEQKLETLGILCRQLLEGSEYNYILSEYVEKYLREYVKRYELTGMIVEEGDEEIKINTWMDLKKICGEYGVKA